MSELSVMPLSRTELEKRAVRKYGTHATFEGIFQYLVKNGYVKKNGSEKRAPYCLTDKGKRLLEGI